MTALNLVVLSLAVYRAWRLVALDDITQQMRQRLLGFNDDGARNAWPRSHRTIGNLVHCPFCLGFWLALATWLCFREWPHGTLLVCWPLAISAVVGLVAKQLDS